MISGALQRPYNFSAGPATMPEAVLRQSALRQLLHIPAQFHILFM